MDRRVHTFEMLEVESDDPEDLEDSSLVMDSRRSSLPVHDSVNSKNSMARRYVGELISRVEYGSGQTQPHFVI